MTGTGDGTHAQPTLDGCGSDDTAQVVLAATIKSEPWYSTSKRQGHQWACHADASPDIWHADQGDGSYVVHARRERAQLARSKHLRPGDRAEVTGVVVQRRVELAGGGMQTINHLYVTDIQVISREPRVSTTAFARNASRAAQHQLE